MKDFSDFNKQAVLDGEKVSIESILNTNLEILNFAERNSRYAKTPDGKYIIIQIKQGDTKKIIFTASRILNEQLIEYREMLPFTAQITNNGKYYTFKGCEK
jgi:hypothetical protein